MENTNKNSQTKNNSSHGLRNFGLAILVGFLLAGSGLFFFYTINSSKQTENQSAVTQPITEPTPAADNPSPASPSKTAPVQPAIDLMGKWSGKYKVTSPGGCAGFSGTWTATLTQSGDSFSGSYKSDVLVNGVVSGTTSGAKGFSWKVSGGGGAQLTGSVTSPNAICGR